MGHVLSAVEIQRGWSAEEVITNLRSCFDGKIPEDTIVGKFPIKVCVNATKHLKPIQIKQGFGAIFLALFGLV